VIDTATLEPLFHDLYARPLDADIFGFRKTRIELRVAVVDARGMVLFDSLGRSVGADFSQWRDVRLALQDRYGARTTLDVEGDPPSAVMHVAAPLKRDGEIVGAVSVGKQTQSFGQFVAAARRKTLLVLPRTETSR
jgi:two-component system sensor histidine kinase CreC